MKFVISTVNMTNYCLSLENKQNTHRAFICIVLHLKNLSILLCILYADFAMTIHYVKLSNTEILSWSRTSVTVKTGLFNDKIQYKNDCYTHKLINQLNEQDLLCHSILNIFDLYNIID